MVDLIRPLKIETTAEGSQNDMGYTETDPNEDYPLGKGFAIEDANHRIELVDNEIAFVDPINNTKKLSDFATGLSEGSHKLLDQLVHEIAESSYYEITYDGTYPWRISKETWYTGSGKTAKIREITYTYDSIVWKYDTITIEQYNSVPAVSQTLTGTVVYDGIFIDYITWVLT